MCENLVTSTDSILKRQLITKAGVNSFKNFVLSEDKQKTIKSIQPNRLRATLVNEYQKLTDVIISNHIYYKVMKSIMVPKED